jgi:hypothetical protein
MFNHPVSAHDLAENSQFENPAWLWRSFSDGSVENRPCPATVITRSCPQVSADHPASDEFSDREIADRLCGVCQPQQPINSICRRLAGKKLIVRRNRQDGILGNYLSNDASSDQPTQVAEPEDQQSLEQTEDRIKHMLNDHLTSKGWMIRSIAWGKKPGIDIEAECAGQRWLIEVKGIGSRSQMRANYFLGVLGELLCRMTDRDAKYSIAVPDVPQFRNLWRRLPAETKSRTRITALFVGEAGVVEET